MKDVFIASSKTCGPCTMLKNKLTREGITVDIKYYEDDLEIFKQHEIRAVPRLVIIEDGVVTKMQGMDDIIQYLKDNVN